jgi:O-antigen/teichoic acid export membrane protein
LTSRDGLTSHLSITVGTSILIQLITIAGGVILARALGSEGRGTLALAMLWPSLVAAVGILGVSDAVVYRASREGTRPSAALSTALLLALPQGLLLCAAGWLVIRIALNSKPTVAASAEFYLLYIPLNLLGVYAIAFLQGRMAMSSFNWFRASVHVFYTALLALLWFSHQIDVWTALAASLVSNALTVALCIAFLLREGQVGLRVNVGELRSLISLGLKLNLGNIAGVFASRVDIVMLSFVVTAAVVGDYVVATAVGALPLIVPSGVSLVLYPLFSRNTIDRASRAFARFMLIAILMTLAAVPIVIFISPLVVNVFFGKAFNSAIVIAQILGIASLLRGMNTMLSSVLRGLGAPIRASGGDILALIVTTIALLPGIRLAQADGAAAAVLIGTACGLAWLIFQSLRVLRMSPLDLLQWWGVELGRSVPDRSGVK